MFVGTTWESISRTRVARSVPCSGGFDLILKFVEFVGFVEFVEYTESGDSWRYGRDKSGLLSSLSL